MASHFACVWLQSLLALLVISVAVGADWEQKPANRSVQEGQTVTFQCRVRNPADSMILVWNKGGTTLFVNAQRMVENPRLTIAGEYDLVISDIIAQDRGKYSCNVQGLGISDVWLDVLMPPQQPVLTDNKTDGVVLTEGQIVIMKCESRGGNPSPNIAWYKNGNQISNADYVPATQVDAITSSQISVILDKSDHQANYSCRVYNSVNQNSPKVTYRLYDVQYAPRVTFDLYAPLLVKEGSQALLRCLVDSFPTKETLKWKKDGTLLSEDSDTILYNRAVKQNSGTYQCIATNTINGVLQEVSSSTVIDVLYPPKITIPETYTANESSPLNISCIVDANPAPYSIRWEGPNSIYSSPHLAINAGITKAGNYSCTARNTVSPSGQATMDSVATKYMILHVQYAPGDAFIKPYSAVVVGESLKLTCTVERHRGYPSPTFEWKRSGMSQPFPSISNVLMINAVTLGDIGNYTCTPHNIMGRGRSDTTFVDVNALPQFLDKPDDIKTVQINNSNYWVRCNVTGRPAPRITWLKNEEDMSALSDLYFIENSPVQTSESASYVVTSTLFFQGNNRYQNKLMISDMGSYTCRVESDATSDHISQTMELVVLFPPQVEDGDVTFASELDHLVMLTCRTQSSPQPYFEWYRHGNRITANSQYEIEVVKEDSITYRSNLSLKKVGMSDMGEYRCLVRNSQGQNTQMLFLTTITTPAAPENLLFVSKTWESVSLEWESGFNGGFKQTFFISYSSVYGEETVPEYGISHKNDIIQFNVTSLRPHTSYRFQVYGQNLLGKGSLSEGLTEQTNYLAFPMVSSVPEFMSQDKELIVSWELNSSYCIRIEISRNDDSTWELVDPCVVTTGKPIVISKDGVKKVNISICLQNRYKVCGLPVAATIKEGDSPDISENNVIIIGASCAALLIILLIVLIVVICRRKKSKANGNKAETNNTENSPNQWQQPPANGNVHANTPKRGFDNADTLVDSRNGYPPQFHSNNPRPNGNVPMDTSYESQMEKPLYENEMNRRNANISFQNMPRTPVKDPQQFIDISVPDQKIEFGSLNSHGNESGYSTPDPTKQKKVIYEVVV